MNYILILLLGAVLSCKTEVSDSSAKFKSLVPTVAGASQTYAAARDILVSKCSYCHSDHGSYSETAEEDWPNHPDINLFDPNSSPLLVRTQNGGGMPKNAAALSEEERSILRAWVLEMAGNGSPSEGTGGPIIKETSPEFIAAYDVIFKNCVTCHTVANSNNLSSFEFSSQKGWAESGFIKSKDSAGSLLFQRIEDGSMPPDPIAKSLDPNDVKKIKTWIDGFEFSSGGTTTGGTTEDTNRDERLAQAKILLQRTCAQCHTGNRSDGGFNFGTLLGAGSSYEDWDAALAPGGQQLFELGNPNASRIFIVLINSGQTPGDMPRDNGAGNPEVPFTPVEINTLRTWINRANDP